MTTAFSTCWNSSRHQDGADLIREILDLGFDTVELSHGMNVSLLPGITRFYEKGRFRVCGLHNFCPSPVEVMIDAPDVYEFTSYRQHVRDRALSLTRKTIEFAARFQAGYVVLHMGSVAMKPRTTALEDMVRDGHLHSRRYVRRKLAFVREREGKARLAYSRARDALRRLADEAAEKDIVLAVESRSHYEQVPSEREMVELMDEFAGHPGIGYWHDFGHVQRKHNLGLLDHAQWLEKMRPHLVGCHVHDVEWPERDHRVPFMGDMGMEKLIPLLPAEVPMVWELSSSRRRVHIRRAREAWDALMAEAQMRVVNLGG